MSTSAIAYYSATAEQFHATYQGDANRLERVRIWRAFLDRHAGGAKFAYDIGCGSGVFTCELARRGIETVGIDGAAPMLAIAQENALRENLRRVRFLQQQMPFADTESLRKADLITASSVIEYLPSIPQTLAFLHAMLRDNGILIFSVSNRHSLSRALVRSVHALTGLPRYLGLMRHFVTLGEIQAALQQAGFACLEHSYCGRADALNLLLGSFLPVRFSSNMIILAARKL